MALFKCKMCGGSLEIDGAQSIATCEYCGTKQTVPRNLNEIIENQYNRANVLRLKCEFDKSEGIYEKIVEADPTQADAYWGIVLCKYGVEYVNDPKSSAKIPTCHRASHDPIIADDDYKSAMRYADFEQREVYEKQAAEIDRIQREILVLAQKEEQYDVFICYKETDSDGRRTHDSVIANDIYHQLTKEGFKVFYSAITLEGKIGSAYEPIIFAALNSAKVMLVIGTKPEYFNAVWVKNEWSRFLKIIKSDRSKLLIPCYRDMDAYELPEEFAHLQAQDMSKIGFINDIIHGVRRVCQSGAPQIREPEAATAVSVPQNTEALLKRAALFLEDGEWRSANSYCEKVLDIEPENATAYLYKLMAEVRVKRKDDLVLCQNPLDEKNNYQKVIRFGTSELSSELIRYNEQIKIDSEVRKEKQRIESIYRDALNNFDSTRISRVQNALSLFREISDYKDSSEYISRCHDKLAQLEEEERLDQIASQNRRQKAKKIITRVAIIVAVVFLVLVIGIVILVRTIINYNNQREEEMYASDNITLTIVDKIGADKYSRYTNGYITCFEITIENGSTLYVDKITGNLRFYDKNGKELDACECSFNCDLYSGGEGKYTLTLDRSNSEVASQFYNADLSQLRATFELTEVVYTYNYVYKEYDVDPVEVLSLGTQGETEKLYVEACKLYNKGEYSEAAEMFYSLGVYKNNMEMYEYCLDYLYGYYD